jgi:hypothetical protein
MQVTKKNNKITKRQEKKAKQAFQQATEITHMCEYLEKKWKTTVMFQCNHCLKEAYESVIQDVQGYVTDEELLQSSLQTKKPLKSK